ncbi:kinase-like domain [Fusarium albosuccineum]|uniref:Kinase-like domain n=1 Tax=Fusarium albosuccineum TaxID=1237068 RepID=A0A8H4L0L5_9HYPO|nr:kinase-like domain [Fusarium albosuccineum]
MDPASIIGTTSAVLTFVDTVVKIFSIGRQVHDSATDGLEEHKRLRDITFALEHGIATLEQQRESKTSLSAEENSLLKVATHCRDVGKKISDLLARYQIEPDTATTQKPPSLVKKGTGRSFKKATKITLRILWDQPEAKELKQEFNMCTVQLNAHLTLISRSDILQRLDDLFTKCRQDNSTNVKEIRNALETTLVNVSEKSNGLIKQIDSMELKLDQLVDDHSVWLGHINKLRELFETSRSTITEINCQRVLQSIAFQSMKTRHMEIANVELAENTFKWMVKDETVPSSQEHLKQSFRNWLEHGEGIFHISGKPGSGKSTLMSFLVDHPETKSQLIKWARNGNMILIASMFLWNLGSVEQKSMDGVRRTLLYAILNEHKKLIPQLFGNVWNLSSWEPRIPQQRLELSSKEINIALQNLIADTTRGYQYCFFIDGVDEFEDPNMFKRKLAAELIHWSSHQGVKICVSSREEAPWITHFADYPKLELHLATKQDIRKMIENHLSDDRHLNTFDPAESEEFVSAFVKMASGVFIWVKLVLRELEAKLDYEVSLKALYQVLYTVPEKLDEFYERILLKIPSSDIREAWAILDILVETAVWENPRHFNVYQYSLVGDLMANPDFYQQNSDYILSSDDMVWQALDRIDHFRKRIPLLFRGLVEVTPIDSWVDEWFGPGGESLAFCHRSMGEYLRTGSFHDKRRPKVDKEIVMLKCFIGQVNRFWDEHLFPQLYMRQVLRNILFRIQKTSKGLELPVLGMLDEQLFRRQLREHEDSFLDFFESSVNPFGVNESNTRVVSVFSSSCAVGFQDYIDWAIRNRPSWREDESFRAAAVASVWGCAWDTPIRSKETLKILFRDGFGPNSCWTIGDKSDESDRQDCVLKNVQVEIGASQDGQQSEKSMLSFGGKQFPVSKKVISRFPHGGPVREILLHFGSKHLSTFFDTCKRDSESTEVESQSECWGIAEERERERIGIRDLPMRYILIGTVNRTCDGIRAVACILSKMSQIITPEQLSNGYKLAFGPVYRINPTTVVKTHARMAEVEMMKFVRDNTSIPVPEVQNAYTDEKSSKVVIVMDYVEGKTLKDAWIDLTEAERESVISQLRDYMTELHAFKGDFIGCINGTACNDQYFDDDPEGYGPYKTEEEFNQGIVKAMKKDNENGFAEWRCTVWLSVMKDHEIVLTHGDFDPRNIIVQGDKVAAILDWELSGYYPSYWEYGKAMLRPEWEGPWSRSKAIDKVLEPFHKELAVMWSSNDVIY